MIASIALRPFAGGRVFVAFDSYAWLDVCAFIVAGSRCGLTSSTRPPEE